MTILFWIIMLAVFGKMIGFSIRCAWGLTKILLYIVFLPVILIGMVLMGFIYLAFPILLIVGVIMLINSAET